MVPALIIFATILGEALGEPPLSYGSGPNFVQPVYLNLDQNRLPSVYASVGSSSPGSSQVINPDVIVAPPLITFEPNQPGAQDQSGANVIAQFVPGLYSQFAPNINGGPSDSASYGSTEEACGPSCQVAPKYVPPAQNEVMSHYNDNGAPQGHFPQYNTAAVMQNMLVGSDMKYQSEMERPVVDQRNEYQLYQHYNAPVENQAYSPATAHEQPHLHVYTPATVHVQTQNQAYSPPTANAHTQGQVFFPATASAPTQNQAYPPAITADVPNPNQAFSHFGTMGTGPDSGSNGSPVISGGFVNDGAYGNELRNNVVKHEDFSSSNSHTGFSRTYGGGHMESFFKSMSSHQFSSFQSFTQ